MTGKKERETRRLSLHVRSLQTQERLIRVRTPNSGVGVRGKRVRPYLYLLTIPTFPTQGSLRGETGISKWGRCLPFFVVGDTGGRVPRVPSISLEKRGERDFCLEIRS